MLFPSSKLPQEYGGLGVRQLNEFNAALLRKWCWRLLVDREGLWYRVLAARYGVERGRLRDGGRRGSSWWREIARIRDSGGGIGVAWFGEGISKKVGDGSDTLFWSDFWVDGIPLCERFWRLFYLAETQLCSVAEMASLGWGGVGVEEAVERVGGGYVGGCLSTFDFIGFGYSSCRGWSHLAPSGSLEERLNRLNTYFSFAALLALFGLWSVPRLDLLWWTHTISDHFAQFTLSAGAHQIHYSTYWTRLRLFHIGG
ncbi:hypothetical protein TSUD_299340 [Trifolium subterraneum]|nr:hypothetical protein TSUD_299340 [Trifolium subterraneum]